MELSHWSLSSNNIRNVKSQFVYSFFQIYKYHVRKNLKSIPSSINNDLTTVPDLTWMAHSWLRQFMFVYFGLRPCLLFSVEYKDVIDNTFLSVSFPTSKCNEVLTKLSWWMTISSGWWLKGWLAWIYFNQIPRIFMEISVLLLFIAAILSTVFSLDWWLTRYKWITHIWICFIILLMIIFILDKTCYRC